MGKNLTLEQGPIRPPNEAGSLLIRVTRNCPWNRCLFCPVYKKEKFSRRPLEEVKQEIDALAQTLEKIRAHWGEDGEDAGASNGDTIRRMASQNPELITAASWLLRGERSVFLQDADSVIIKTEELTELIRYLYQKIPYIKRVTSYARSKTLFRKSVEELKALKSAGLTRLHVGLESGNDEVLDYVKKGVTSLEQLEAGIKVKKAGLTLSHYVILGLGGRKRWRVHAEDTARVINAVNPDFIRVRTLALPPYAPLTEEYRKGDFEAMQEEEIIQEEKMFIQSLKGITGTFFSDHFLNLLEEVQGAFPGDKDSMLKTIDSFLSLPPREKKLFCLGRRTGAFRYLEDRFDKASRQKVDRILRELEEKGMDPYDFIRDLSLRYL